MINSVPVNIVFADLSMPDQMKGLAFLQWLRKHHPATKAIVTSDTETNMPLEGDGMFLSKPYRLADLDYCLQKVLAPYALPPAKWAGQRPPIQATRQIPRRATRSRAAFT